MNGGPTSLGSLGPRGTIMSRGLFTGECNEAQQAKPLTTMETLDHYTVQVLTKAQCELEGRETFLKEVREGLAQEILSEKSVRLIMTMLTHMDYCVSR